MNSPRQAAVTDYDNNFCNKWKKMFDNYNSPIRNDRVWIAGPSAYIFHLCGQRFAVDLQIRRKKDFDVLLPGLIDDTADISFVLITHQHDDHMCIPLMNALKDTSVRWYIPKGCPEELIKESGIKSENIIPVSPGDVFKEGELTIRAFYSPHIPKNSSEFMAQCGYEISAPDKKILMPGDVRDYDYSEYPQFCDIDFCFSHVWAGNDALCKENFIPMLDKFASFTAAFGAKRYILGHLYELAREEIYLWNYTHAGMVMDKIYALAPESDVQIACLGRSYSLMNEDWR